MFKETVKWAEELTTIWEMGKGGSTMVEIAEKYGVSRQRMKQITKKYFPTWKEECGFSVKRTKHAALYRRKWGEREYTDLYDSQREKFRNKRSNAIRSGHQWEVAFGDLEWPKNCPILGITINYFSENRVEESPSFDRINNNVGYVKDNVHVISWRANRIKNDGTSNEHRKIADYLDNIT